MNKLLARGVLAVCLGAAAGLSAQAPDKGVRVVPDEAHQRVVVTIDGKPFTSYIWPSSLKKPVLYPLSATKGSPLREAILSSRVPTNVSTIRITPDLWFNYGNVNGFDFWNNSDAIKPEDRSKMGTIHHKAILSTKSGVEQGELTVDSIWTTGQNTDILEQTTRYIFARRDHARVVDLVITLKALDQAVFSDNKEGLLGMRVARWLESPEEKGGVFMDANGNPTQVDAAPIAAGIANPATGVLSHQ